MPLSRDELGAALRLVDQMIHCNAQLHANPDGHRRLFLEAALAVRAAELQCYVGAASEVFVTPEQRSARLAFETETINRAFQHDLVLFANVTATSDLVFRWRAPNRTFGPQFDDRELAIDWIARWLAEDIT
jgi:hypothetical protein